MQLVGASLCVTNLQVLRFQTFAAHVSVTRQSHKHEPQTIFSVSTKYNCLRHTKSCYISSTRSLNMTWCSSCDHQQICLLILEGHTWSVIHLLMCPAVHMYEKEYFWAKHGCLVDIILYNFTHSSFAFLLGTFCT